MLTIYRRPRSEKSSRSSSSSSEFDNSQYILPPGRPYITKVNGRLVMARDKRPRPTGSTMALLGSAFGFNTRIIRRRSQSVDSLPSPIVPLMIAGEPHIPTGQQFLAYSAPLLQNGFQPIPPSNMIPTSQILQSIQYQQPLQTPQLIPQEPTRYRLENQATPSKEEIEALKNIHAHFTAATGDGTTVQNRVGSAAFQDASDSMVTKTTITIAKHVCANCGRIRSKKYHHENPIKLGEAPMHGFCRKCQRDASSTSSEDRVSELNNGENGKKNSDKRKVKFKAAEAESDIATAQTQTQPNQRIIFRETVNVEVKRPVKEKFQHNNSRKNRDKDKSASEYVVIEDEYSDDESTLRRREHLQIEDSNIGKRPLSPLISKSDYRESRVSTEDSEHEIPVKRYSRRERYLESQALTDDEESDLTVKIKAKKIKKQDSYFEEEPSQVLKYNEDSQPSYIYEQDRKQWRHRKGEDKRGPVERNEVPRGRTMLSRDDSFGSNNSCRSQQRRQERLHPDEPKLWEKSHGINPRQGQKVVVTETYTYRPKREAYVESEDGVSEYQSREHSGGRREYEDFSYRENRHVNPQYSSSRFDDNWYYEVPQHRASRHNVTDEDYSYYQSDWLRDEPYDERDKCMDDARSKSYRRASIASDTSSILYRRAYDAAHQNIPRAPTPPQTDYFSQQPPSPLSGNDESGKRPGSEVRAVSRDREKPAMLSINTQSVRPFREVTPAPDRVPSRPAPRHSYIEDTPRPSFVHERSYVRTSKADDITSQSSQAIIPSPKFDQLPESFYRNSFNTGCDDGFSVSDFTEREEAAEAATSGRKVKFQGPDEVIDASDVAFRKKVDEWEERGRGRMAQGQIWAW